MGQNIIQKIVASYLLAGDMERDDQLTIRVDHTIWSDSTGMMAGQMLESVGAKSVRPELSIIYADHNTLQISAEYTDDQKFERTAAERYGMVYSKSGNGIMHSLHCQRFAVPGKVVIGADSHTVTSGAVGMLAIGAGGLAVGQTLVTADFKLNRPKVIKIDFSGELKPGVSAKDAALYYEATHGKGRSGIYIGVRRESYRKAFHCTAHDHIQYERGDRRYRRRMAQ